MSEVTLQVGGRGYTIACADGEEDHVRRLAEIVDGKLSALGTLSSNDSKNLLFAALILADEVSEKSASSAHDPGPSLEQNVCAGLELLADRLEGVADKLENPAPAS